MPEPAKPIAATPTPGGNPVGSELGEARSQDLVFAIVGYAGAGPSRVAEVLSQRLQARGYNALRIAARDAIFENAGLVASKTAPGKEKKLEYALWLQDVGDALRAKFARTAVAGLMVKRVRSERRGAPTGKPLAFVLDSLKHPDEVQALRDVYGSAFHLVSILCRPDIREERLADKLGVKRDDESFQAFLSRDEEGTVSEGQHVRKTLHLADFFVANESKKDGSLGDELDRFLNILTGRQIVRPTLEERGMYAAAGAALRSSCLSRQVGAALFDDHGELVATGTNDVPMFHGGLYPDETGNTESDHRCFVDGKYCRNDATKIEIYEEVFEILSKAGLLSKDAKEAQVRGVIEQTRIKALVEFSRAVHAEMDALVSLARTGSGKSVGGRLFCTTFPCHNCARHLVAAGISEVVYLEPYTKSLASKLHSDAIEEITIRSEASGKKVSFRLFSGVAPRRYASVFEKRGDLKDRDGKLVTLGNKIDLPTSVFRKSYLELENSIADQMESLGNVEAPNVAR